MTDRAAPGLGYGPRTQPSVPVPPRLASRALYASLVSALLAMVAISLFFAGAGGFWGPVNDLLVVATVLLLLPAVVAVRQIGGAAAGIWLSVTTWLAVIGIVIMAAGQSALVLGLIDLETSFMTGTVGVLLAIAWIGGTGVLALRTGALSRPVGWWAVAFVAMVAITTVGIPLTAADTPALTASFGGPLLLTLAGWMVSLARDLAGRES